MSFQPVSENEDELYGYVGGQAARPCPTGFFFFERMTCALGESIQHSTVSLFCRPSFVFFTTVARAFRHVVSTVKVVKPRIIDFYLFSRRMCQPCCFVDVNLNRVASEYV